MKRTPLKAIHAFCVECVGSAYEVRDCGGDRCLGDQGDEYGVCYFYQYRMGKGRPKLKVLRSQCLECMGGQRSLVKECESLTCPIWPYRMGKNPSRAGLDGRIQERLLTKYGVGK